MFVLIYFNTNFNDFFFTSQERLQADEVIQALDTQSVWGQGLNINPKDEL